MCFFICLVLLNLHLGMQAEGSTHSCLATCKMGTLVGLAKKDDSGFKSACLTAQAMPEKRDSIQHQPGNCHGKGTGPQACFMHTLFSWKMHKHLSPPSHPHVLASKINTHQGNKTVSFMENQSCLTMQFQPLFQKGHSSYLMPQG